MRFLPSHLRIPPGRPTPVVGRVADPRSHRPARADGRRGEIRRAIPWVELRGRGGTGPAGRMARLCAHGVTGTEKEITGAPAAGQNGRLPLLPPTPPAAQKIPNGCRLAPNTETRAVPSLVTCASAHPGPALARAAAAPPRPPAPLSPARAASASAYAPRCRVRPRHRVRPPRRVRPRRRRLRPALPPGHRRGRVRPRRWPAPPPPTRRAAGGFVLCSVVMAAFSGR